MSFLRSPLAPRHSHSPLKPYRRSIPALPFEILLLLLAQDPPPPPSLLAKLCLLNSEVYFLVLPYLYRKVVLDRMGLSMFFWGIESKRPKVGRGSFVFKLPPELAHVPTHYGTSTEPLGIVHPRLQSGSGSGSSSGGGRSSSSWENGSKSILRSDWKENMSRVVYHDTHNAKPLNGRITIQVEPCAATERRKRYALSLVRTLVLLDGGDTQVSEELGYIVQSPNPYPCPQKARNQRKGTDSLYASGGRKIPDDLFICQSSTPILDSFAPPAYEEEERGQNASAAGLGGREHKSSYNVFRRFSRGSGYPVSPPAPSRPSPISNNKSDLTTSSKAGSSVQKAEEQEQLLMPNVQRLVLHAEMLSNLAQWRFISPSQAKDHEFVQALQGILGKPARSRFPSASALNSDADADRNSDSDSESDLDLVIEIRGSIANLSEANTNLAMRYPKSTPNPPTTRRFAADVLENLCAKWSIKKIVWHDLGLGGSKSVDYLAWIKDIRAVEWHFADPDVILNGTSAVNGSRGANGNRNASGGGAVLRAGTALGAEADVTKEITPAQRAASIRAVLLRDLYHHQDLDFQQQLQQQQQQQQQPAPAQVQQAASAGASAATTINNGGTSSSSSKPRTRTRYTIIGAGSGISSDSHTESDPIAREYEAQDTISQLVKTGSGDLGGGRLSDELWDRVEWVACSEMVRSDMNLGMGAGGSGAEARGGGGGGCGCYPFLNAQHSRSKVDEADVGRPNIDTGVRDRDHGMRFEALPTWVENLASQSQGH
ncbi:hypothetical protein IAU59_005925 [Kwoniella sp. CBS 9459]